MFMLGGEKNKKYGYKKQARRATNFSILGRGLLWGEGVRKQFHRLLIIIKTLC